jgi:outer membrane protein OmpA-like peptidoglycan-associated protein
MTQIQSNTSYALLALALAASLLYRPVIAADPEASQTPAVQPGAGATSEPLQQDFDALISEIEARQPAQDSPAQTEAGAPASTTEEQLNAARIQIGILQQAVIAALAARAEAEAELEALWRDSRAQIDALKAAQSEGGTQVSALESEPAGAKGEAAAPSGNPVAASQASGDVQAASPSSDDAAEDPADVAPAAGPRELMLNEIHFNPGSAALTPGGERKTLEAAEKIRSLGASNIRVSGYTDTQGPAAYNMHLSLQRARSIADLLESVGVSAEIMEVEGHGEDGVPEPTADQVSEPLNRCAGIFAMVDLPAAQQ